MKEVIGFLTEDETFFEHRSDAEYHEAYDALHRAAEAHEVDPQRLIPVILKLRAEVRRFIDAKDACAVFSEHDEPEPTEHIEYVEGLPIARAASSSLDREDPRQSQATSPDLLNKPPRRG